MAEEKLPTEEQYRDVLQRVKFNDTSLKEINLNNLENSKPEWMIELLEALSASTTVETIQLVNCNINNEGGKKLADVIKSNSTITNINVETNKIGTEGIKAIAEALETNTTLKEIKITNQASPAGNETERLLAKCVDANKTLQKVSASIKDTSSRNTIDRAVSRNKEIARKARQAQKHS